MPRRLVVFSDPGGAKPCLALAEQWAAQGDVLVCSDRQYAFFQNFSVHVRRARNADAAALFEEFQPDKLFTGTSYTSRIETTFIREAQARGVHSTSFIDHYTSFRERFLDDGNLVLPDRFDVLDETAGKLAIKAGLPETAIHITGNPYHRWLRSWKPKMSKAELWHLLALPLIAGKTILFMPDPISNTGGVAKYGTDEAGILRDLLQVLAEQPRCLHLIIKPHPNQDVAHLRTGLLEPSATVAVSWVGSEHDAYLNDLMTHADLVVGMFSSALTEAGIVGTPVLRIPVRSAACHAPAFPDHGTQQFLRSQLNTVL